MLLTSCSSGPQAPEKGTPAFYWQAAKETSAAGDFLKTNEHLSKILKGENEFTAKAQVWQLVLAAGLSKGYMEYANAFEYGARANKTNPLPFRKQASDLRTPANALALETAELFGKFKEKNKEGDVLIAFPFPNSTPAIAPQIAKASQGLMMKPDEIESGMTANIKRHVLLAVCGATGNKDDVAKTQEMFKAAEVKAPRAAFIAYFAQLFFDQADLYSDMKLNNPDRRKIFLTLAQDALKLVPASKDTKELATKIEEALKKTKK